MDEFDYWSFNIYALIIFIAGITILIVNKMQESIIMRCWSITKQQAITMYKIIARSLTRNKTNIILPSAIPVPLIIKVKIKFLNF